MDDLKSALTGAADTPFVFLGNFEVERYWGLAQIGLPTITSAHTTAVVNRMDEFALLLGGKGDYVVLKAAPDKGYVGYLEELGLDLPSVLAPAGHDPGSTVTEDALGSPELLGALSEINGGYLFPHGVSVHEERLAERTGLPLAAAPAAVCEAVNSKVYSRRVADELGLRQADGRTCSSLAELEDAVDWAGNLLADGRTVVVKDAFGVSGKGLVVVTEPRRLAQLHRMVAASARRAGHDRIALVVENWVAKRADLNYQFTVGTDGSSRFDFVKEAITENGVHTAHRMPTRLTSAHQRELAEVSRALGARLADDGYFGVVGVDALVDSDGGLYPVLEINARNNMSTYQAVVQSRFLSDGKVASARHFAVRLPHPLPFDEFRVRLGELLLTLERGVGLLVNNFATVNAAAAGRLYGFLVADDDERLAELEVAITHRLKELS